MHINFGQVWNYVYGNRLPIISAASLIISSAVKTLPTPGTPFNTYTFVYDWSHQFLNITNTRLTAQPVITPPDSKGSGQQ